MRTSDLVEKVSERERNEFAPGGEEVEARVVRGELYPRSFSVRFGGEKRFEVLGEGRRRVCGKDGLRCRAFRRVDGKKSFGAAIVVMTIEVDRKL